MSELLQATKGLGDSNSVRTASEELGQAAWERQCGREAGEQLRDWIVNLTNTRFSIVTEILMKRLLRVKGRISRHHDLFNSATGQFIEVKFSVVRKAHAIKLNEATILQCVEDAQNRLVPFEGYKKHKFDCNIQHIRKDESDEIYYGLMFADCVKIFCIASKLINRHRAIHAARQTKGNRCERQFHICTRSLRLHLRRYLWRTLTYEEVLRALSQKDIDVPPSIIPQ